MAGETRIVIISEEALRDFQAIYDYGVETFSPDSTDVFAYELLERIHRLSDTFLFHTECRFLPTKSMMYRSMVFHSYSIIYRITRLRVEVLAILHSSQIISKITEVRKIKIP